MTNTQKTRLSVIALIVAICTMFGIVQQTSASEVTTARKIPRQTHCLTDSSVEEVLRGRLTDILDPDRDDDSILDTLNMAGSSFTRITNDSLCARAVIAYADLLHNTDSADHARSLTGFPAVMLVQLKPNRFWIATDEFAPWGTYQRVLVDSSWALVSRYP